MQTARGIHFLLMALIGLLTSSCGFHLRDSVTLPEQLQATSVQGVAKYSEPGLALSRLFRQAGYPLTVADQASSILQISKSDFTRRVLSVDASGVSNEYELQYTLVFSLRDKQQKELLPRQTITVYRSYRNDPGVVIAKASEEQRLKKDMVDDAARQLMRRLSKITSTGKPDEAAR